jgi:hypothetical protein
MTRELQSAMVYPFLGTGLTGEAEKMEFITAGTPGPAAWYERRVTEDPIPPEQDLRMVGYRLLIVEDEETGDPIVLGLQRTEQKVMAPADAAEEGSHIHAAMVAPRIRFLRLSYFDGSAWTRSWDSDLPLAVEIAVGAEPLPPETSPEEYPYELHRRTVYLPGGTQALSGTIIRGGPGQEGR